MTAPGPIIARENLPYYVKWGWHFRPTDVELINDLDKKVKRLIREESAFESKDDSDLLREIDLSRFEPWEIKDVPETCSIRAVHRDEHNQFFYTQKEQKYRHGKRNNRATRRGFWKATGRDKPIYAQISPKHKEKQVIGYRKALVFYEGRAPTGVKTDWILHEFRLENSADDAASAWVACHMFIKERNLPPKPPHDLVELQAGSLQQQQQEQHADRTVTDMHHNQLQAMKEEPGYPISHLLDQHEGSPPVGLLQQEHLRYVPQYARDELSLPHLVHVEESSYSNPGVQPNYHEMSTQHANGGMAFDDRDINDILDGLRTDQHQSSYYGLWE